MTHTARKLPHGSVWQIVWGYAGLYTIVNIIALIFLFLIITKRVRVHGYARAFRAVLDGNVIIASNHPSALETFVLPVLFWPLHLLIPRLYGWSVARFDAFPQQLRWLYKPFRCILVEQTGHSRKVRQQMEHVLHTRGVLICYPESTRTCKAKAHYEYNGRKLGVINAALPRLAQRCSSTIVPVWIDFGSVEGPLSMRACIWRVLCICPLRLSFGESYAVRDMKSSGDLDAELIKRLFTA